MVSYFRRTEGCISFVKRKNEEDYIRLTSKDAGCFSQVGRKRGRQNVNLQSPNCLVRLGTVQHELYHALGFFHEHSRTDRDEYISIVEENVDENKMGNFNERPEHISNYGQPYDYSSVMHYSRKAFSKNGKATIIPRKPTTEQLGQRRQLSRIDVYKLLAMYNCPNAPRVTTSKPEEGESEEGGLNLFP